MEDMMISYQKLAALIAVATFVVWVADLTSQSPSNVCAIALMVSLLMAAVANIED